MYWEKKAIGDVIGKTFFTVRNSSNYFRIFQGFGLSESVIKGLFQQGIEWVVFEYKSYGTTSKTTHYRIKLVDFVEKSKPFPYQVDGRVDNQKICAVADMERLGVY